MTEAAGFDPAQFVRHLTTQPGVYRMLGAADEVLYVGKARNLKKRVSSYFMRASGNPRIEQMVDQIRRIEVDITLSEDEALLLESNLIKSLKPRYNVCLRDDKSYPYIAIDHRHAFPRARFHRGARVAGTTYLGPFPSASTVRETLSLLERVFKLRNCTDSEFENRTRPCLQYQIKRCSAPCVGLVDKADYGRDVRAAEDLLRGRAESLIDELGRQMERHAENLEFEQAAELRDRIGALRRIQEQRVVTGSQGDMDVVNIALDGGVLGMTVMCVRAGRNLGQQVMFPRLASNTPDQEILGTLLAQYYTAHEPPAEIVVPFEPDDGDWLQHALTQARGKSVKLNARSRGVRRRLLSMTDKSLREALRNRLVARSGYEQRLAAIQDRFDLPQPPRRLECFDISHTMGEAPVASCVVFDEQGPARSQYRRFNIQDVTPGDDYAAINQAIRRRFARIKKGEVVAPDVLFIDGGVGQVGAAQAALRDLEFGALVVIGVAKGPERKAGLEELIRAEEGEPMHLDADDPALHLIQQIRDEAHRFAITGHRGRRGKARTASALDDIPGLGPKRRAQLLRAFGGTRQIARASVDDLARASGISRGLAQRVYDHFHEQ